MSVYSDHAGIASRLILQRGDAVAAGERTKGQVWGQTLATLGDLAGQGLQMASQHVAQRERQKQIADIFAAHPGDLDAAIESLMSVDPQLGTRLRAEKNTADRTAFDFKKLQHDQKLKEVDFLSGLVGSATDQTSYTRALYTAHAAGLDTSNIPQEFDPKVVESFNRSLMTAKERLDADRPKPPQLQRVDTVDDGGQPVTQFVAPTPGQSFPKPPTKEPQRSPAAAGSFEDYVSRKYGPTATPDQILQARKAYGQADDRAAAAAGAQAADVTVVTPGGLDLAALNYKKTGVMPTLGTGDRNTRQRIINRAAELTGDDVARIEAGGGDLAGNKAEYGANASALKKLTENRAAISSFERTAEKNVDLFLQAAGKVVDTGSPLANQFFRAVSGKMLGSPDQAAFEAARQVAINEIAKITNGGGLSGVLSDSARHEIAEFNPKSATLKQTVAVLRLLKQDMRNRATGIDEEIAATRGRIGGGASTPAAPKAPAGWKYVPKPGGGWTAVEAK